ncbi:hypothetical protein ACFPOI_29620 [Nonomuraea angiospora]|uniref:Uncharacterized protein n=1 Tax=Nonomuraea angiospora TaxID=46172 RepID=A0ABR9LV96_9ACTN|nr:hypothetical protein [Nonomuraea angiospora]MBE1584232.1 hypothetical protein [Nonomuraea angiospora]
MYAIPESGTRAGTLEVYYNSSSGKNCALTYGYGSTAGTTTFKAAAIRVAGGSGVIDSGHYAHYAGPAYVSASGKCIDVSATAGNADRYLSGAHCG